ncbi:MAG TPA: Uma2 family endonuclease [Thermoguttaceae bacterium]|nr:Uma2 family endonuclease [Thermoguttaceae bacterium]
MNANTPVTSDELLHLSDNGFRYELVAGELKKKPLQGWRNGMICGHLLAILGQHARSHELGQVLGARCGFLLASVPDTLRVTDVAFVAKDRWPPQDPDAVFYPGAPDLAVEVVSPGDTTGEVDEKVRAWLDAGAEMVWVVNPMWRSVTVYRSATDIKTLTENDELDGEDVVPGFRCRVADVFANL